MMQKSLNFIEEEKLLQKNSCKMGELTDHIIVDRTPEFHLEVSGECIEQSWGCARNYYRRFSLDDNNGKKNFKTFSKRPYQEITLTQSRFVFYISAHGCIILYKLMSHIQNLAGLDIYLFTHISVKIIYNMVEYFKTHRCALDFDRLLFRIILKVNR